MAGQCWICRREVEPDAYDYLQWAAGSAYIIQEESPICKGCKDRMVLRRFRQITRIDALGLDPNRTAITDAEMDIFLDDKL